MGDIKGAIEDYEKTISLDPDDAIAYNNLGLLQEQLGYKEKS
jgi:tetratricopeptide (TPR) repeat protein